AEATTAAGHFHEAAKAAREILSLRHDQDELAQLAEIEQRFDAFYASGQVMAAAYLKDGLEAGNLLMKGQPGKPGFDQASTDVSGLLGKFRDRQLARTRQDAEDDQRAADRIQLAMVWGGLAATVLAALFGWLTVRAITGRIGGDPHVATRLMQRVGAGDLSAHIRLQPGDTDSLMAHLDNMTQNLRQVVNTVRAQALGVAQASAQMADGNQALSQRTAAQASALEETAATMAQLSGTVQQGVDGARQAGDLARAASESANHSGSLVARFVDTMQGIETSSRQIADITSLINGIAFQTNILALKAAEEAA
ncbi:MAG: methyl-accepting chemotaxis protein, partial [Burkholderiales bacterium PBB5]